MSWERYDDSGERWSWTADDERHLLVLHDGELREYHEVPAPGAVTVHVYEPTRPDRIVQDAPLVSVVHQSTYTVAGNFAPWVRALDDFELIEWLMGAKYVNAV
jgi:hypothetical protein